MIQVDSLKKGYYLFGNKGTVWANAAHISKGNEPTTMCGLPMLSTNHARIEGMKEIGCPECIAAYQKEK